MPETRDLIESTEIEVNLDRNTYVWDGVCWYDRRTFLSPTTPTIQRLNQLLENRLSIADDCLNNFAQLIQQATRAKNAEQYQRAERLARRALLLNQRSEVAVTVLSSALRAMGRADEAISATNEFQHSSSAPLLTTRAASLCDLERWPEALQTVRRALAASLNHSNGAFAVYNRIRANAPQLF